MSPRSFLTSSWLWHVLAIVIVSAYYESIFLHHGVNHLDEGWPLYVAMRLHEGGVLYEDAFFVFPPGHVLISWIGYWLEPPGIVPARRIYAAFTVALCVGLYALGRRIMTPTFALLGALLLCIAAPRSHEWQLIFGYRYLVITVLVLLAFGRRLDSGDSRWTFAAGLLAGVALVFRLTPAFSVSVGVGLAVLAASRDWRIWLRDWGAYGSGIALAILPVVAVLAYSVGLERVWSEVILRPVEMVDAQSLSVPELFWPGFERGEITQAFVALEFRLWWVLYAGYAIVLGASWLRCLVRRERYPYAFLLAVVTWGGVFFARSPVRADEPHLDSAIPPICLLLAHLAFLVRRRWQVSTSTSPLRRVGVDVTVLVAVLCSWGFLLHVDRYLDPEYWRYTRPLRTSGDQVLLRVNPGYILDGRIVRIRSLTQPDDTILTLGNLPIYYVLARRLGPGYHDVVMPATFRDAEEELRFLRRLQEHPPAVIVWPEEPFDGIPERAVEYTAPQLAAWVRERYRPLGGGIFRELYVPVPEPSP